MKKLLAALLFSLITSAALAQGTGSAPGYWLPGANNSIYYPYGGVSAGPYGSAQGTGTVNADNGFYVAGSPLNFDNLAGKATLAQLPNLSAASLICNPSASQAAAQACTIQGLTADTSPTTGDLLLIYNHTTGLLNSVAPSVLNTAAAGGDVNSVQYNNGSGFGGVAVGNGQILIGQTSNPPAAETPSGDIAITSAGVVTVGSVHGVAYPSSPSVNTVPVVTSTGIVTYEAVPNSALANDATTVNGQSCVLGATCTITAAASNITIGSTGVLGGSSGEFLTDASNVLGEVASTGSGSVVLDTGASIGTPAITGGTIDSTAIGSTTPSTAAFTTVSANGIITSSLATGTAPFSIASTTVVPNLNVSELLGDTWAIPGTIGSTTPNTGKFSSLTDTALATAGVVTNTSAGLFGTDTVLPVSLGGTNGGTASGTLLDNITGWTTGNVGLIDRTGSGAYSFITPGSNVLAAFEAALNSTTGLISQNGLTTGGTCVNSLITTSTGPALGACPGAAASIAVGGTTVTSATGSNDLLTTGTVSAGTGTLGDSGIAYTSLALLTGAQTFTGAKTFGEVIGAVTTQSGTTYTFANTDCGTEVDFTSSSAVTATIPATMPVGCNISVLQAGTAKVSVNGSAVTPATLESHYSYTGTAGQWAIIGLNIEANSGGSSAVAVLTGDGS